MSEVRREELTMEPQTETKLQTTLVNVRDVNITYCVKTHYIRYILSTHSTGFGCMYRYICTSLYSITMT